MGDFNEHQRWRSKVESIGADPEIFTACWAMESFCLSDNVFEDQDQCFGTEDSMEKAEAALAAALEGDARQLVEHARALGYEVFTGVIDEEEEGFFWYVDANPPTQI